MILNHTNDEVIITTNDVTNTWIVETYNLILIKYLSKDYTPIKTYVTKGKVNGAVFKIPLSAIVFQKPRTTSAKQKEHLEKAREIKKVL